MRIAAVPTRTITITQALPAIEAKRDAVENWLRRGDLHSWFAPVQRGESRPFSKENVMELAVLSALIRVGIKARIATGMAARLAECRAEWLVITKLDSPRVIESDDLASLFGRMEERHAVITRIAIVRIGQIIRNVHPLFEVPA